MISRMFSVIFISFAVASAGCARTEKVRAVETGIEVPYESLGTLEVRYKTNRISSAGTLNAVKEGATLTLADTPSRAERYKMALRSELARRAKKEFGAHAVIHVTYWPDLEASSFPDGYVHARGEMVRYTRFPDAAPAQARAAAVPPAQ